ncbi:Coenzyme A biosynthesis bifunctional protein CoaBC (Includes: Phosphopantothenoylcysteine decarboxylase; Phosphopantothenate--cysteine ligase) [uncultured Paludibacter sp.]|nr:Coenzyme A biosynthesis bifunctional protein CoaBC (Includes: Phosphopantothenoylcysteine decarboxylase; Phosphopantothenate--cysteine ligase) [uncultured Paludibacter sp.]
MLQGKKILLGITGSIAAYKSAVLVRELVKKGAEVKVIMTPLAKEFITPLTMATLSQNPILVDFFNPENGDWNSHVDLGIWADAYVIAPATANSIAKMTYGIADNLLLTTYLSSRAPVFIAPAMDLDMFAHPTTQENIKKLEEKGCHLIYPASGFLASGLEGKGRMEEPENIAAVIDDFFTPKPLKGKKVLITAGPTYENIDPVRFIGNYSTGKMGFALAETCALQGAEVTLISGPVQLKVKHKNIKRIDVKSGDEMFEKAMENFVNVDIAILCAAVADFKPKEESELKIKHGKDNLTIELIPNKDIAKALGEMKKPNQKLVGFALETNDEEQNAVGKMERKNFDFIVLNSLNDKNAGFGFDTNKITILHHKGEKKSFELKSKEKVAEDIVNELIKL